MARGDLAHAQEEIGNSPGAIDNPWEIGFISAGSYLVGAIPALLPFLIFADSRRALLVSAAAPGRARG